jgi:hypothetical protein
MIAVRPEAPPAPPGKAVPPPVARATHGPRPAAGATGLALACLLAGAAAAQAPDQPAPPPGQPAATETIPPGTVLRLLGRDVTGPGGQVVAQIMNVLVDATGQPRAAILDYGGFLGVGKRRIAVAWRALRFAPDQAAGAITLALSQDQLKNAPEFKPDGPLLAAAPPEAAPAEPAPEPVVPEPAAPEPPAAEPPAPAQPAAAPD